MTAEDIELVKRMIEERLTGAVQTVTAQTPEQHALELARAGRIEESMAVMRAASKRRRAERAKR